MKLFDIAFVTVGNVELIMWDSDGRPRGVRKLPNLNECSTELFYKFYDQFRVSYLYSKIVDGEPWTVIELSEICKEA